MQPKKKNETFHDAHVWSNILPVFRDMTIVICHVMPTGNLWYHSARMTSVHTYAKIYYRQTFNIRRTLPGNIIVNNSDVVGASPVGAAPTTSSLFN